MFRVLLAILFFGSAMAANANLLGGPEPLSPEVAFDFSIGEITSEIINVNVDIEDGYYLYRDKTSFSLKDAPTEALSSTNTAASATLGKPLFPQAVIVDDEFFGEMAIYRGNQAISIPVSSAGKASDNALDITFQGCADIGLCYPPTTVSLPVKLLAQTQSINPIAALSDLPKSDSQSQSLASPATTFSNDSALFDSLNSGDELLPPELAYLPQIISADTQQISVRWFIEPGYYLYRDKLSFGFKPAGLATLQTVAIDPGVDQFDEFFGNVKVFRDSANAQLRLAPSSGSGQQNGTLIIHYQGCADIGVCFPPSTTELPLTLDASTASLTSNDLSGTIAASSNTNTTSFNGSDSSKALVAQSEQDRLFNLLGSTSLWLIVATFFGLGLLLAFTPCVLPMVPILSSLIVGQGNSVGTFRAFQLSLVYVLVMASTYAIVGIIVGLSGYNVQAFLQNPWVLSAIAALFVLLALSMFGFYELQMPVAMQEKLMRLSNSQHGGQVTGVAVMGFISTLIVGPCVTAPLAGALIYIAKTGDAVIGGSALFALGLGMGAPLLLIGTSAGKLVPKAGRWMDVTKQIFGIIMLAMAIYMLSRVLPPTITMALSGTLAVMSGIYLGAMDTINRDSNGWQRFTKGLGVVVTLYGVSLFIGSLSGSGSYLTPLRGVAGTTTTQNTQEHGLAFTPIKGLDGLQLAVANASAQNKPVMLDFYADWCVSCKEMEAFTFTDEKVQALLEDAIIVQADVTKNDAADQALLKQFDLFGPPGIIFFNSDGQELPAARVVGFMNASKFSEHIERFL